MSSVYYVNIAISPMIQALVSYNSHLFIYWLLSLKKTGQLVYPPELIQWFQLQKEETTANNALQSNTTRTNIPRRYKLPAGWKVKDLPPSLKPPPSKHGYNWDINTVGTWSL